MLEFAYTGEVNVGQDLLPALLHTARSFRIKGLDKVENPIDPPPPLPSAQLHEPTSATTAAAAWGAESSGPPTRSHTPSSHHSQQDVKPFFLANETKAHQQQPLTRPSRDLSPSASLPCNSRPATRENSPCPPSSGNSAAARTPPPKRWKRSFDMTQPSAGPMSPTAQRANNEPLPMVNELIH